jgi:hypothetical protein
MCKDLAIEMKRMWNVKPKMIPVIIGTPGTISKSYRKYLSNVPESTKSRNYKKQPYWALLT